MFPLVRWFVSERRFSDRVLLENKSILEPVKPHWCVAEETHSFTCQVGRRVNTTGDLSPVAEEVVMRRTKRTLSEIASQCKIYIAERRTVGAPLMAPFLVIYELQYPGIANYPEAVVLDALPTFGGAAGTVKKIVAILEDRAEEWRSISDNLNLPDMPAAFLAMVRAAAREVGLWKPQPGKAGEKLEKLFAAAMAT